LSIEQKNEVLTESNEFKEQEEVEDSDYDPDFTQLRLSEDEYSSPDIRIKRQRVKEVDNLEPEEGWDMMKLMERKEETPKPRTSVCLSFFVIHDT